jgi:hypothetical protein
VHSVDSEFSYEAQNTTCLHPCNQDGSLIRPLNSSSMSQTWHAGHSTPYEYILCTNLSDQRCQWQPQKTRHTLSQKREEFSWHPSTLQRSRISTPCWRGPEYGRHSDDVTPLPLGRKQPRDLHLTDSHNSKHFTSRASGFADFPSLGGCPPLGEVPLYSWLYQPFPSCMKSRSLPRRVHGWYQSVTSCSSAHSLLLARPSCNAAGLWPGH